MLQVLSQNEQTSDQSVMVLVFFFHFLFSSTFLPVVSKLFFVFISEPNFINIFTSYDPKLKQMLHGINESNSKIEFKVSRRPHSMGVWQRLAKGSLKYR
jgi:hypothetical protein